MLNSQPIAAGNNFRFYGLVFNDNGALRMDCAQVNDGVAFNPPQNSAAQAETAKVTVRPALQAGVQQTVTVSHTR